MNKNIYMKRHAAIAPLVTINTKVIILSLKRRLRCLYHFIDTISKVKERYEVIKRNDLAQKDYNQLGR